MGKVPYSIRLDDELLEKVRELSKLENRSVNNLIETVLRDYVNQKKKK